MFRRIPQFLGIEGIDIPVNLETVIRMEDIIIDIPDNLETAIRSEVCIYKVPTTIRKVRETAYTPLEVSIGLIHNGNRVERMELQKKIYLQEFFKRFKTEVATVVFRALVRKISEQKQYIINCYAEDPNISQVGEAELVKMILLDAVFIMELFLRNSKPQNYKNDTIIWSSQLRDAVQRDLLLLENQLPFNFLDLLYGHSLSNFEENYPDSFLKLTCDYFSTCGPRQRPMGRGAITNLKGVNFLHFTDVVRHFWLIDNPGNQSQVFPQIKLFIPSATSLRDQAGVEFKSSQIRKRPKFKEKKYLLWKKGKLTMSKIIINNITEAIIRNVMALEIRYYPNETYVCNYVTLLDYLINTVEDVNLLVKAKIIINRLGDNALIAKMINELSHQIDEGVNCYYHLFEQLDMFYQSKDVRRMTTLKRVYFKDTWTTTATIVGAFVLVFQIAQTFSSIWQIAHGSK